MPDNVKNIIIVLIVLLILGGAIAYIVREKRRGTKCIGCPDAKTCAKKSGCNGCSCCNH